jgi:hypothetical protein
MRSKTVRDIMLPLAEYAVVGEETTLRDALLALEAAQAQLPPHAPRHRAVLVADSSGRIVGKLGQHALLAALEPKYASLGDLERLTQAGLSTEFVESIMENYRFWQDDLEDVCRRARAVRVRQVMRPVEAGIAADASLTRAIHLFVMWNTLSLLVTEGERAVGILRLSDLFREVSRHVTSDVCADGTDEDGRAP